MKKFLSMVLAAALVLAVIVPAKAAAIDLDTKIDASVTCAEMELAEGAHRIKINLAGTGVDPTAVCGIKVTMKVTDLSSGLGGGIVNNSESAGWWKDLSEWGNEGANKPVTMKTTDTADVYTIEYKQDAALFTAADANAMNIVVVAYWGKNIDELLQVDALDKDGKVIYSTKATAPESTPTPAPVPSTGDTTPVAVLTLAALATVLVVATARKKATK